MSDEGVPQIDENPTEEVTSPWGIVANGAWEKARGWLRVFYVVALAILLIADIALYSLYQAEHARIEALNRRMDRSEDQLLGLRASQENQKKLQAIETKVVGIENQLDELAKELRKENETPEAPVND